MPLYETNPLQVYNSLSGKKENFKSIHEGQIGMYVCGPTVYSNVHLGNVRTFMSFDMIYRYLLHLDYKVRYVRNITDAGHLTDDGNVENDRFVKQSRLEQLEPMEIVQKYTVDFHRVLETFNLLTPTIEPTATGHILEQIELTQKLIETGFAYESNGSVYFDVLEYNKRGFNYGKLSNRNIEELFANTRDLDGQSEKKNPQDFALWKNASPVHIMRWNSPWGAGFPGWHLECTAMSAKYLGENFDIHGGGLDLKFPHHECEVAQGTACNGGVNPVNYWMHANMLTMNGLRMSKSTGNYILPMELVEGKNDFFEKEFNSSVVRFCFMQAHYRGVLDISNDAMLASEKGYNRLMEAIDILSKIENSPTSSVDITAWKSACYAAMNDDFNTTILIAQLFEAVRIINVLNDKKETISAKDLAELKTTLEIFVFDVLGLTNKKATGNNNKLGSVIEMLIEMRMEARANKNWALSDEIRDKLAVLDIQLKDGKDGTSFTL